MNNIRNIYFSESKKVDLKNIDLFITSLGVESRTQRLINDVIQDASDCEKLAFQYSDNSKFYDSERTKYLKSNDFRIIECSENENREIIDSLGDILTNSNSNRVLIDYSSMNKLWIRAMICSLDTYSAQLPQLNCIWAYTPAIYKKFPLSASNYSIQFMDGIGEIQDPRRPCSLISSLGIEYGRALGVQQYLQVSSEDCYAFMTDNEHHSDYYDDCREANQIFLESISSERIIEYTFQDLNLINFQLNDLILRLNENEYRVIIDSSGPKPFSLCCLFLPEVSSAFSIIRSRPVSSERSYHDRIADYNKDYVLCKVVYQINKPL